MRCELGKKGEGGGDAAPADAQVVHHREPHEDRTFFGQ
jgi:hypothetical protein